MNKENSLFLFINIYKKNNNNKINYFLIIRMVILLKIHFFLLKSLIYQYNHNLIF